MVKRLNRYPHYRDRRQGKDRLEHKRISRGRVEYQAQNKIEGLAMAETKVGVMTHQPKLVCNSHDLNPK